METACSKKQVKTCKGMKALIPGFLLAALVPSLGSAAPTGNDLLKECRAADNPSDALEEGEALSCVQYIGGVADAFAYLEPTRYCPPDYVTRDQTRRIVVKWLNAHPEKLHHDAAVLTLEALVNTFPCSKGKGKAK
jgi:hypothetical protein